MEKSAAVARLGEALVATAARGAFDDLLPVGRYRDPEQVLASKIDELDALEARETIAPVEEAPIWPAPAPPFGYLAGPAGCLSGETVVECLRGLRHSGRPETLATLYLKFNGLPYTDTRGRHGHPVWDLTLPTFIQSVDDAGIIFYNRIVGVYQSGVKALLRIEVDGEQSIRATADHLFLTPAGFVEAGSLRVGERILAKGSMLAQSSGRARTHAPRIIVTTKYHPFGAYKNVEGYEYMRVARARLVVEAALNEIPYDEFVHALKHNQGLSATFRYIPTDFEVHHDDENTLNDDLSNLVVLSKAEHARLHDQRANFRFDAIRELTIRKIESVEDEMTYDVQMESPANNFCANGLLVHNCGKTFAVKAWQQQEKGLMLCATTGIAAINLGGTTINAALGYFDSKSLQESYTNGFLTARLGRLWKAGVRRLVVDEVSMLSGDQLTFLVKGVEEVNGRGYVLGKWDEEDETEPPAMGLTLVGDFAQLPPVKEPFAWESPEWPRFAEHTVTLSEIRRQTDADFVQALRQARVGNGAAVLEALRGQLHDQTDDQFEGPTLFAKNDAVDRYNWIRLSRVQGQDLYFESRREGEQRSEWGNPKKEPSTWGIPIRLHTKVGALVMILANEREEGPPPQPFIYVNGDLGEVTGGDACHAVVRLQRTGQEVDVTYTRREVLQPIDSARRKELRDQGQQGRITENGKFEITGWIEYLPLRTAYASTVHKSQGLSLDRLQVNIRDAFFKTGGMLYVALSRCRTREGLRIVGSEAALIERCAADPRLKAWL